MDIRRGSERKLEKGGFTVFRSRVTSLRRMKLPRMAAYMKEIRNIRKILLSKHDDGMPFERAQRKCEHKLI